MASSVFSPRIKSLGVLSKIDPEAAYCLLENEEMPGWLFMLQR